MVPYRFRSRFLLKQTLVRLAKCPGFSLLAVAIFAVGIGSTCAVFWLLQTILIRPLPYRNPGALFHLTARDLNQTNLPGCLSFPHLEFLRSRLQGSGEIAAYANESLTLTGENGAIQAEAARVTPNFFRLLGTNPLLGSGFRVTRDAAGLPPQVMMSHSLWRNRFASEPTIVGRSILLNAKPFIVVGVLPQDFRFDLLGKGIDLWATGIADVSLFTPAQVQTGSCYLNAIVRVRDTAQNRLPLLAASLQRDYLRQFPDLGDADPKRLAEAIPLKEKISGSTKPVLFLLSAAVVVLLLISCSNVGGLLLARSLERSREIAVRAALGATPWYLASELLLESLLLSCAGSVAGYGMAMAGRKLAGDWLVSALPRAGENSLAVELTIPLFAIFLCFACALLCGLIPSLHLCRRDCMALLREQGRGVGSYSSRGLLGRTYLLISQTALAAFLLVCAGSVMHGILRLTHQPIGFEPDGVTTLSLSLSSKRYNTPERIIRYYSNALTRVLRCPGVEEVAIASALPVNESMLAHVTVDGEPAVSLAKQRVAALQSLTPSYLQLLRIPLLSGRFFTDQDTERSPPVTVINRAFAQSFFHGASPLGRFLRLGGSSIAWQVIGVVGDVKNVSLMSSTQPEIEFPFTQLPWAQMNFLARHRQDFAADIPAMLRQELAREDRDQPVKGIQPLTQLLSDSISQPKVIANGVTAFAAMSFALAIVGLYVAITYSTLQRQNEFAIRLALGADRQQLIGSVVSQGLKLTAIGLVAGLVLAALFSRYLSSFVYDAHAFDLAAFLISAALFLLFAFLAALLPAWRATRIAPMALLRNS